MRTLFQQLVDQPQLVQDRAPRRFRRVSREHGPHVETMHKALDLIRIQTGGSNTFKRVAKRIVPALAIAHRVHTVKLLRRVGQVEIDRERPDQPDGGPQRNSIQLLKKCSLKCRVRVLTQRSRTSPDALNQIEKLLPELRLKHTPKDVAKQPDISTQCTFAVILSTVAVTVIDIHAENDIGTRSPPRLPQLSCLSVSQNIPSNYRSNKCQTAPKSC